MIAIAEPYARYARTLGAGDLEPAAGRYLEFAERIAREYFSDRYERFGITVVAKVEIGSTRTWVTVWSLVNILTFYGNIRQSVDYLVKDAQHLGGAILSEAPHSLGVDERPASQQKRLGIPGQLRRLFIRVESGDLSPDEATSQALRLLERHGGVDTIRELPRLTQQLASELRQITPEHEAPKAPAPPKGRRPTLGLPPTVPSQRRRGAIASRDAEGGRVGIITY